MKIRGSPREGVIFVVVVFAMGLVWTLCHQLINLNYESLKLKPNNGGRFDLQSTRAQPIPSTTLIILINKTLSINHHTTPSQHQTQNHQIEIAKIALLFWSATAKLLYITLFIIITYDVGIFGDGLSQ